MKTRQAKVKATNQTVTVYKLVSGNWCNYQDCTTEYKTEDLQFLD